MPLKVELNTKYCYSTQLDHNSSIFNIIYGVHGISWEIVGSNIKI